MPTSSRSLHAAVLSLAAALAFAAAPAAAQSAPKVLPAQSEIGFTFKQMGVPVDGKFSRWTAEIAFDPKKPEAGKVAFAIAAASVTLGSPEADADLPKPVWFNVPKFPQATFASTAIHAKGPGRYEVAGKLTIKGTARDIVVPLALAQSGPTTTASGQFPIKRLEYRIGEGEWADTSMVADDVVVKFRIALTGVAPL